MVTATEARTYEGWTNYETWVVKLWMGNEEPSYRYWQHEARHAKDAYALMSAIKDAHEEAMPDLGASVFSDLLGAAMSEVNWYEIAESLFTEAHEDEDNDDEPSDA